MASAVAMTGPSPTAARPRPQAPRPALRHGSPQVPGRPPASRILRRSRQRTGCRGRAVGQREQEQQQGEQRHRVISWFGTSLISPSGRLCADTEPAQNAVGRHFNSRGMALDEAPPCSKGLRSMPVDDLTAPLGAADPSHAAAAKDAGADAADAIAVDGRSVSIDVRKGGLEQAERSEGIEIGLRVFVGQRQACISSSDTRPETLAATWPHARSPWPARRPKTPMPGWPIAPACHAAHRRGAGYGRSRARTRPCRAARGCAPCRRCGARHQGRDAGAIGLCRLRPAGDLAGGDQRVQRRLRAHSRQTSCVAISGEGTAMERDYCGEGRVYQSDLPDAPQVGQLAAERAVARMARAAPRPAPTRCCMTNVWPAG